MEAKTNIRRLLAGSSFIALLAASEAALGAPLTNPAGNTTAFVSVTVGQTYDSVANLGIIQNSTGHAGIEVNGGTITGGILNSGIGVNEGLIDVSSTSTGVSVAGILVNGVGTSYAYVDGAIANVSGTISAHGLKNAVGIGVGIVNGNVSIGGGIFNSGAINADATNTVAETAFNFAVNGHAVASTGVNGSAYGIALSADLPGGGIDNQGTVDATAHMAAAAHATAVGTNNATATAIVNGVGAWAAGANIDSVSSIAGDITNSGSLTANATATARGIADATALGGTAYAKAYGWGAQATAYGLDLNSATVSGAVNNSGTIDGNANANSINTATASGTTNAYAVASGHAYAQAYGVAGSALIGGDFHNSTDGLISADAHAVVSNNASATVPGGFASALAGHDFNYVSAYATGVAARVTQNFTNDGTISANAIASMINNATAHSPSGAASASAGYEFVYANAGAVGAGVSVGGNFSSTGLISADATAKIDNNAYATGSSNVNATAGYQWNYASAVAVGVGGTVGADLTVASSGTVEAHAVASILNHAQAVAASGYATAYAGGFVSNYHASYAVASATGVHASVGGNFNNEGTISADATAKFNNTAIATGTDYARAYAGYHQNYAQAYAVGASLLVDGNFSNSGLISANAFASMANSAVATASGAAEAYAGHYSGTARAMATGALLDSGTIAGTVTNAGTIAGTAAALSLANADAQGGSYAHAYAMAGDANAHAFGLRVAATSLTGSVSNSATGVVTADSTAVAQAQAHAEGTSYGYAYAYARAGGSANAYATGFVVDANTITGSAWNEGSVSARAVAGALNGDILANFLGASSLLSAIGTSLPALNTALFNGTGGALATGVSYARAHSTSDADAGAVGFVVYSNSVSGSVGNNGDVDVISAAIATNVAHALVSDHGIALATAEGTSANAWATGISMGISTLDGNVSNTGSVVNVAAIAGSLNRATALGSALGTSLSISADASAQGSAYAHARGLNFDINSSINGGIVNTGEVNVIAGAGSFNSALALTPGGRADARALDTNDAYARAYGLDAYVYSGSGDVTNSGALSVVAGALALDNARAAGTSLGHADYALAYATGGADVRAVGMWVHGWSVTGSVSNESTIDTHAFAGVHNVANAVGDYAYAYAYNYDAIANATGISVGISTQTGDITNSGHVTVGATAAVWNEANATGGSYAVAGSLSTGNVNAVGLNVQASTLYGTITNEAAIDVTAALHVTTTMNAHATGTSGGYAYAYSDNLDNMRAAATGLRYDGYTLGGSLINSTSGAIGVHATAIQHAAANATGSTYARANASGSAYAGAFGIVVGSGTSPSIGGNFTNDGNLTVGALASYEANAFADPMLSGGVAYATAEGENADARGGGIYANLASLTGGFSNSGEINVNATAKANSSAKAYASSYAQAISEGTADARAYGIDFYASSVSGNFTNDGAISVTALAQADNKAVAIASGTSYGYAYAYGAQGGEESHAIAEVTGINAGFGSLVGNFDNNANVTVRATATVHTHATASGYDRAYATAASYADAYALGVAVNGQQLSSYGGHIANNSLIDAVARALATAAVAASSGYAAAYATARATGMRVSANYIHGQVANNSATISAHAYATAEAGGNLSATAGAYATALGVSVYTSQTLGGGFSNSGHIVAAAQANATGIDHAYARASATGVSISTGFGINDDVVNTGFIRAIASANASASAESTAGGDAHAHGFEIYANNNGIAGSVFNEGTIEATAIVHATPAGPDIASAYATGMYIHVNGSVTGISTGLGNGGLIKALAIDPRHAVANGVIVDDGWYWNDLYNSGTILAHAETSQSGIGARATALELRNGASFGGTLVNSGAIVALASGTTAVATAVKVTDSGYFSGGIENTGVIGAVATGVSMSTVAINLNGAGAGETIQQLGGSAVTVDAVSETPQTPGIYGDITMVNSHTDTINWSGGNIGGTLFGQTVHSNIYGDSNDTLNVFAGNDSEFTYADNIQGLYEINVNTGAHAATGVSLTVSGDIGTDTSSYNTIQNLNVNENGKLTLEPTAQVNVANMTVAGTGANPAGIVQWNMKPTVPQFGQITAGTVTIGSGAQSIAHALPGLFAANNDFLVIASTDITGTFNFSEDFTNLYTVEDSYQSDGYHVTITRLAFGDIPGLDGDGANIGQAIDNILDWLNENDPEGDLAKKLGEILIGTPDEYAANLNALAGSQNADLLQAALNNPSQLMSIIFGQLGGGGGGSTGVADLGVLVKLAANAPGDVMSDAGPQYASLTKPSPIANAGTVWARAFGNWASLDRSSGVSGFTSSGGGAVVGADYRFTDTFKAGLAVGYQRDNVDYRGTGKADIDSLSINAYGRYDMGAAYVDGLVGYGHQSYSMDRHFTVLGVPYTAHRSPNGDSFSIGAEAGYAYDLGDEAKLTPFLGVLYNHTKIDGSTETGAAPFNLTLDDQTANTVSSRLGVRWTKTFSSQGGTSWTPELALGWKHDFGDQNPSTTASFAGIPGSGFTVVGADAARDSAIVGAGVTMQLSDQLDGTLQYDGDFSSNYSDSTASLRLRLKF